LAQLDSEREQFKREKEVMEKRFNSLQTRLDADIKAKVEMEKTIDNLKKYKT
jgi:hypothetical protein